MASRDQKGSGRERELDSFVRKTADHSEINLLLDIHVEVVIRIQHKIDDFKIERGVRKLFEVRSIEAGFVDVLNQPADHRRNGRKLRRRGIVGDSEAEQDAALEQPLIIVDTALQQIAIRKDDFLSRQTAHPGALYADMFDRAGQIIDHDEMAHRKWLIDQD